MTQTKEQKADYKRTWRENNSDKVRAHRQRYNKSEKGKEAKKRYRQSPKGKLQSRKNKIKSNWGWTPEYYDYVINDVFGGKCERCGTTHNLVPDHCHGTGKVRGVLCNKCNRGIGLLGDTLLAIYETFKYMLMANNRDKGIYVTEGKYGKELTGIEEPNFKLIP